MKGIGRLNKREVTIQREKLYEQIWSRSVKTTATEYGVSDKGLAKICKKLNIPTPPPGYFAKRQHGYSVKQQPLHKLKPGQPDTHILRPHSIVKINKSKKVSKIIKVSERLTKPHPLVAITRDILKHQTPDKYGALRPTNKPVLNVRVFPENLRRSLLIMDAVIKAFVADGYEVHSKAGKPPVSYVMINGEKVRFFLFEEARRIDHIPTKKELEDQKRYSWMTPEKWDYVPSGILSLNIEEWWSGDRLQKKWSDGTSKKLEDKLGHFYAGALAVAEAKRQSRIRRQEEQRIWEEHRRRQEELERQSKLEEQRRIDLESQAQDWIKAKQIRAYIRTVERKALSRIMTMDELDRLREWSSWAREHADRVDPMSQMQFCYQSPNNSLAMSPVYSTF